MNPYSAIKGYFRFKKLWRNRYVTRYRVVNYVVCWTTLSFAYIRGYIIRAFSFKVSYKHA